MCVRSQPGAQTCPAPRPRILRTVARAREGGASYGAPGRRGAGGRTPNAKAPGTAAPGASRWSLGFDRAHVRRSRRVDVDHDLLLLVGDLVLHARPGHVDEEEVGAGGAGQ